MIKTSSAFLAGRAANAPINVHRARVLITLLQSRMSVEDLAEILNCSESVVRLLLVQPYRPLLTLPVGAGGHSISLARFPPQPNRAVEAAHPRSEEEAARQKERLTDRLYKEVCNWLAAFEASDRDRQKAVEEAGLFLYGSAAYSVGKHLFAAERLSSDILVAWNPPISRRADRQFPVLAGRWMAAWIRFWVVDPEVWEQALDLAFAYFGAKAEVAA